MSCHIIPGVGFMCSRGVKTTKCFCCERRATYACDFALCDRPLCETHRFKQGYDTDYCYQHDLLKASGG